MIVLNGARVFSAVPRTEALLADVLIDGSRISAVGPGILVPPDTTTIDVSGCTVLPGLINLHEHLTMKRTYGPVGKQVMAPDGYLVIRGVRAALGDIRSGITTIRETGAKNGLNIVLKRAIQMRAIPGPRVLAGQLLSSSGGHASVVSRVCDGPDGIRRAVREAVSKGFDWVKVIATNDPVRIGLDGQYTHPEFTEAELQACVDETHRWCKRISVHAMGTRALGEVIRSNPDTIEHGVYLDAELAGEMVDRGVALVPTLSGYHQTMLPQLARGDDWAARHSLLTEPHRLGFRAALEAGVVMGVGTDTAGLYVEELQMMVDLGMSTTLALQCATRINAEILGLGHEIGVVEAGKIADLVVVRGDPLSDLRAIDDIILVVQEGQAMRPSEIDLRTDYETPEWNTLMIPGESKLQ